MNKKSVAVVGLFTAALLAVLAAEVCMADPPDALGLSIPSHSNPSFFSILNPPLPADEQVHVDTILARPLFQRSRRPPTGAPAAVAVAARLPRLTGVVVSEGFKRLMFAPGPDGKPITVAEGSRVGTYVVQSISAGEAIVLGPNGSNSLHPSFDPSDAREGSDRVQVAAQSTPPGVNPPTLRSAMPARGGSLGFVSHFRAPLAASAPAINPKSPITPP